MQAAVEMIWTQSYGGVSVDEICAKADSKKGSFYHYFSSKSELAIAAMEYLWQGMKPGFDETFSPQRPPLERLRKYAENTIREQEESKKTFGYIVGCPFTSVGSEQCSCGDGLSVKSKDILCRLTCYLKSAIQDAIDEGSLPTMDAASAASQLLTYMLGALSLARVSNSIEPLEGLYEVWMGILLRRHPEHRTATEAASARE